MSGPLDGIKVVDLGRVIAAPFCAMLLGDLGADVIKVEPPGGDPVRQVRPAFANGLGGYFANANRNKRSVVIDMRTPVGLAQLRALLADADVLVENFRPGVLEEMGLDDAALARDFPRTTIVVNHTGLPAERDDASLAAWRAAMTVLAREPHVFLKISGLGVAGRRWTPGLQAPVVQEAIRIFGWQRCMFASNHPVDALVASLGDIFSGFKQITAALPAAQRLALFCDNAASLYRLH